MPVTRMCLCFLVWSGCGELDRVLLGRKKRGLGVGNIVGLGGKLESGEDAPAAAVREIAEESNVLVAREDLVERARIAYRFPTKPSWDQDATIFVAERWSGEPAETEEISPCWYDVAAVPFDDMWADARHWLPQVLAGLFVRAEFDFGDDLRTLARDDVRTDEAASGA